MTQYVVRVGNHGHIVHKEELCGREPILDLVRSDQGDGGWSLHRPDEFEPILSGPSARDHTGCWARPNRADIQEAIAKL